MFRRSLDSDGAILIDPNYAVIHDSINIEAHVNIEIYNLFCFFVSTLQLKWYYLVKLIEGLKKVQARGWRKGGYDVGGGGGTKSLIMGDQIVILYIVYHIINVYDV